MIIDKSDNMEEKVYDLSKSAEATSFNQMVTNTPKGYLLLIGAYPPVSYSQISTQSKETLKKMAGGKDEIPEPKKGLDAGFDLRPSKSRCQRY